MHTQFMIYAGRNFRAVGDILVSPNTFQQNGNLEFRSH